MTRREIERWAHVIHDANMGRTRSDTFGSAETMEDAIAECSYIVETMGIECRRDGNALLVGRGRIEFEVM